MPIRDDCHEMWSELWLHPNAERECLSVPRADVRRAGVLEPSTPHEDISVALQFCSKRPVPNLTLTCVGRIRMGLAQRPPAWTQWVWAAQKG